MMSRFDPRLMLLVGFVLLVIGFVIPVLMVMQILESTFFLNFFAYGASLIGLVLGLLGAVLYAARFRKK